MSVETLTEFFLGEGWKLQQTKHIIGDNVGLSIERLKRTFGLNHNFNRDEIKRRNDARLKALVDSADSKDALESLRDQLNKWIKAAPKSVKDINSVADSNAIKNHNTGVIADVTALNKLYLSKVNAKLAKL